MGIWSRLFGSGEAQGPALSEQVLKASRLMTVDSPRLHRGDIPEMCFVCAPFGKRVPNDLGDWAKNTQALAAASVLGIEDERRFEELQAKFANTKTVLIPDISANEVLADNNTNGSMVHRASLLMEHKLGLDPLAWECRSMAYLKDAFGRCSPVGVVFSFMKRAAQEPQKRTSDAPAIRHIDLRSDEYKQMEQEVAAGTSSGSARFEALCEQLVAVVQESHEWAQANDFPAVADYPQYQKIRQLGEEIHEVAGYRGMQRACIVVKSRCHTRDGGGESWPAESAWRGIGGWMP